MANTLKNTIMEVAAVEVMASGGKSLVLRSVAHRSGSTTQAIYTQFGGKQGLVEALFNEGWSRLTSELKALGPKSNPLESLMDIGLCYFRFAHKNPNFYQLMVGRSVPNIAMPERQNKYTGPWQTFTAVALNKAISQKLLSGDIEEIGYLLWATCHGMIDLRINGFVQHNEEELLLKKAGIGIFNTFAGPSLTPNLLPNV